MASLFPRQRSARYIGAALAAFLVVSTLYYLQLPAGYSPSHPFDRQAPLAVPPPPWQQPGASNSPIWDARANRVKQAFLHAYNGYLRHAAGHDEIRPLSNTAVDNFNGWNVTMYDSLDTMLLMGLHDEFAAALTVVQEGDFSRRNQLVPFFETVIRYLGGLLSAYALSGEHILLVKADQLATLLEPAFNTAKGLPYFSVNPYNGEHSGSSGGIFAEIASCQMEWTYLAHATGDNVHFEKGNQIIETLAAAMEERKGGMFPTTWNLNMGLPASEARSMGAAADSGHEYLLKQYLLTGKDDLANLEMYLLTTNDVLTRLMYVTPNRGLLYVTDTHGPERKPSHSVEHLACFFPGLLALGAHTLPLNLSLIDPGKLNAEAQRAYNLLAQYDLRALHMAAAEGLATTCWLQYADMPSGFGPEVAVMDHKSRPWIELLEEWRAAGGRGPLPGLNEKQPIPFTRPPKEKSLHQPWDYMVVRPDYLLRPETLESIYLMWKTTGNPVWRERGWQIFEALEREAKTESGYASLHNILVSGGDKLDEQPSYFLAETLKYFYLLFTNDDPIDLNKWVFNTEAHPFPVFRWNSWEKHKFSQPV